MSTANPPEDVEENVELKENIELSSPENPEESSVGLEQPKDLKLGDEEPEKIVVAESMFPMRETRFRLPFCKNDVAFNPVVSVIGFGVLWGFAGYCMSDPVNSKATLQEWFAFVTTFFTWFYIVANPVLTFFILWVAYRFGDIKLGKPEDPPEFSDSTYFAMIFSAGVGVGLFYYGVSESMYHREPGNYYTNALYHTEDEMDQWSLVIAMYHWGIAGWSIYLTVCVCCGLGTYRFGLPMNVRATLFPVIGEYCWGWIGDLIDGYSIVMTVAGVCTSLGLGAIQVAAGFQELGYIDSEREDLGNVHLILIWVITLGATISVVSGVSVGIKFLANFAFYMGCFIWLIGFFMEKTTYLLNLLIQTTGVYAQWNIFQVPFWTDAFGSLKEGEGRAVDGFSAASWWIGAWTIFYLAWWCSWAIFVGMFTARISKNRTLREIIVNVMLGPTMYSLLWMVVFGGTGLRHQRQAKELQKIGTDFFGDENYYVTEKSTFCYHVPQEDVVVNGTTVFTNRVPGITPVCIFDSAAPEMSWYNTMNSYSFPDSDGFDGFGTFLCGLSMFTLVIYFITSSDSGSLVVDMIASNGKHKHHWIQRVFWACTEGAVACALLMIGGKDGLQAVQTAAIVLGLPFNLFLMIMCLSIYTMCIAIENAADPNNLDPQMLLPSDEQAWSMPVFGGILNIFESILSLGNVHPARKEKHMDFPSSAHMKEFFQGLLLPFVSLYKIYTSAVIDPKLQHKTSSMVASAIYAAIFIAWITLFAFGYTTNDGFNAFGWALFIVNGSSLTMLRGTFREKLGLRGNFIADFFFSTLCYPQVLCQMVIELESDNAKAFISENHED